jgi:hypothetical protein
MLGEEDLFPSDDAVERNMKRCSTISRIDTPRIIADEVPVLEDVDMDEPVTPRVRSKYLPVFRAFVVYHYILLFGAVSNSRRGR